MINFIVVEDNKIHRENTEKLIIKYMMKNNYEFEIHSFEDETTELINFVKNNDSNNIFILDFELPSTNAIDLAREIRKYDWRSPLIILTAHAGMALETYKQRLQILDFIPKQYNAEENLLETFDICLKQFNLSKSLKIKYNYVDYNIPYDKIFYIYRDTFERKTVIVTDNSEYKIGTTLKEIKSLLPDNFKYSHKACIINTNEVEAYDWKKYKIYFSNKKSINLLSKTHKKELTSK